MLDRRKQLRDWYGIDFPDDLFAVWELAARLRPEAPRDAFDVIPMHLAGVFDVLAGRFDEKPPDGPLWTHEMSYWDPPEFFTVFWGSGSDHFGLWFDDPVKPPSCIASYDSNDAYDYGHYPANLFLTLRRELEYSFSGLLEYEADYSPAEFDRQVQKHAELREAIRPYLRGAARRRSQTGQAYLDRYTDQDVDDSELVAVTWGQEGISAPNHLFREPEADDETIWQEVREVGGAKRWLREAQHAFDDGYPATALKLGKDVLHLAPVTMQRDAVKVMKAAYHRLARPLLAEVLEARQQQREQWDAERAAREK